MDTFFAKFYPKKAKNSPKYTIFRAFQAILELLAGLVRSTATE